MLTVKVFLNMTKYLIEEKNYLPLYVGLRSLSAIKHTITDKRIKDKVEVRLQLNLQA